jgi:Flp pilus assembly protein TadG
MIRLTKTSVESGSVPRNHRRERAQSLVEFAFVLPIFLLIVMATIDFAWALRSYITLTNSAREGARLAVTLGPNDPDTVSIVQDYVAERSGGLVAVADVDVNYPDDKASKNPVEVKAEYTYKYITPLGNLANLISGGAIPNPLPMASTSIMRIE